MTASKKPRPAENLIEDAILDDLLSLSAEDVEAELREEGLSPDDAVAKAKRALANAEAESGRRRLAAAKQGAEAFRTERSPVVSLGDRERQKSRLDDMKRSAPGASGMMMAARKSEGLSQRDEEVLLDDLADLERLEQEDDEGSRT